MANIPMISFNNGEVTPKIDARTDVEKFQSSCRKLENFLPLKYGCAERRPGLKFLTDSSVNPLAPLSLPHTVAVANISDLQVIDSYSATFNTGVGTVSVGDVVTYQTSKTTTIIKISYTTAITGTVWWNWGLATANPVVSGNTLVCGATSITINATPTTRAANLAKNYYLTSDIDASGTATWNSNKGFVPIGDGTFPFTGTFDGQNYTITDLYENDITLLMVGLFGTCQGATLYNFNISDVHLLVGNSYSCGICVGDTTSSAFQQITVSGSISISTPTSSFIGGFVSDGGTGSSLNTFTKCVAIGVVITVSAGSTVSNGLFNGRCPGIFTDCYASGTMTFSDTSYGYGDGGFVGTATATSTFTRCSATGAIPANSSVILYTNGGFAGACQSNTATFTDCYYLSTLNDKAFGGADEQQQFVRSGASPPTGGTYTITFDGKTTGAIAYNANTAAVQTALDTTFGTLVLQASGFSYGTGLVNFRKKYSRTDVAMASGNGTSLTGTSAPYTFTVTQISAGSYPSNATTPTSQATISTPIWFPTGFSPRAPHRLENFTYSSSISYVVLLGKEFMKFLYGGVLLTTDGSPPHFDHSTDYYIATPYVTADLFDLQFKQVGDVLWITHPSYAPRKLSRTSATTFSLDVISFKKGPFLLRNDLIDPDVTDTALMTCDVQNVGDTGTLTCQSDYLLTTGTVAPMPNNFTVGSTLTESTTLITCTILAIVSPTEYIITEPSEGGFVGGYTLWDSTFNTIGAADAHPVVTSYAVPFFEGGHVGALFQLTQPKGTLTVNGSLAATGYIGNATGEELIGDYTFRVSGSYEIVLGLKISTFVASITLEKSDNGFAGHIVGPFNDSDYDIHYVKVRRLTTGGAYNGTELNEGWFYRIRVSAYTSGAVRASLAASTNSVTGKMTMTSGPNQDGTGVIKYPIYLKGDWRYQTDGNWDGTFVVERNENNAGWEPFRTVVSTVTSGVGSRNEQGAEVEEADNVQYRMNMKIHNSGTITGTLTSEESTAEGIVQVTSLTSDTPPVANIKVISKLYSTDPTRRWAEGAWSDAQVYPSSITHFEERCIYAGMSRIPIQITSTYDSSATNYSPKELRAWLSASGDYENFEEGVMDADAFSLAVSSTNDIAWVKGTENLILATFGDVWKITSNKLDYPLTPTNYGIKYQFAYGGCGIQPESAGVALLYTDGQKVREIIYAGDEQKFDAPDLTIMSEHLTANKAIVNTAMQTHPDGILWCVLDDGSLICMVYERDQRVVAWAKIPIDGLVKSVCVLPGEYEDEVYIAIKRTINGADVIYIEQFAPRVFGTSITDAFFVDCGITMTTGTPTSTVSGLSHLEGKTVKVLGDGVVFDDAVVSSGAITTKLAGVTTTVSKAQVGLAYTSTLIPMKPYLRTREGTTQGSIVKVPRMGISFLNTAGAKYGSSTSALFDIDFDNSMWSNVSDITGLYMEDVSVSVDGGFTRDNNLIISSVAPLPCTVRALLPSLEQTSD